MGQLISPIGYWFLGTLLLAAPHLGASWYKHSASPRYHTVGRASGLLIGVRRSPYLWRRDAKVDTWPVIQQAADEDMELLQTPWSEKGAELQLSSDPGEKWLTQKLIQGNRLRSFKEERSLNEGQDGNQLEQGSWLYNDLEEERSLEDQRTRYPDEELRRSLEEKTLVNTKSGEGQTSPQETWVTKEPSEVVRNLEGVQRKVRNQDRYLRSSLETGKERRPSGEDILSTFLHPKEENRSHSRPWRILTAKDKQAFYSKTSERISCEDFTSASYKVLCRATLQLLSHSQSRSGRARLEAEDPAADL